ncbi:MAG: hypothetical protein V1674_07365 [Candidatus Omnitrophota bacterium]
MPRLKPNKELNYRKLKGLCLEAGADLFGVADISKIKKDFSLSRVVLPKLDNGISLGVRLSGAVLEEITDHPTKLYFHHYRSINNFLDQLALRLSNFIQGKGFLALPIPASQITDWQKQAGHLSHKKIGRLAGLGWIGRNNLLVNKKIGSQFRLVSILTNYPLKFDAPAKDSCASCRECILVCPAKAIKLKPDDFEHLACFEKLREFQKNKLVDQYICGVCVKVCGPKIKRR